MSVEQGQPVAVDERKDQALGDLSWQHVPRSEIEENMPGAPDGGRAYVPGRRRLNALSMASPSRGTEALAQTAHMSPSRFHTVFANTVGETLKQYTLRLRLERAAFRLLSETTDVATIAFDLGFGSHEAFSRAFRSRFSQSPTQYRTAGVTADSLSPPRRHGLEEKAEELYLSDTRAIQLAATPVVFRRYTGPYETVPADAFDQLVEWTRQHDVPSCGLLGIAHDAPNITPPEQLRFDVCVRVPSHVTGNRQTAYRVLPQRWASSTWYSGPEARLGEAVARAYRASGALAGFTVMGLPLEEHYTTCQILTEDRTQALQILIPLIRRSPSE
jgi:AraC family transcriptional regulator